MPVHVMVLMQHNHCSSCWLAVSLLSPATYLANHRLSCPMRDVVNPSHLLLLYFFLVIFKAVDSQAFMSCFSTAALSRHSSVKWMWYNFHFYPMLCPFSIDHIDENSGLCYCITNWGITISWLKPWFVLLYNELRNYHFLIKTVVCATV